MRWPVAKKQVVPSVHASGPFSVRISEAPDDPEWDDFLERTAMGHHAQTSAWGRGRTSIGWQTVRVVVSEAGQIVAGAQMVTRPLPFGGDYGFVCRGPVARDDLAELVLDEVLSLGRARNVQYMVVQPPRGGDWMCPKLVALGFRRAAFDIDHTATVLIDLAPDLDEILARLPRETRKQIRRGERLGAAVRRGSEADLPIFNRLKDVHSARLGYARREAGYYEELWRDLSPRGHIGLLVAEYEGEPVSVQLAIPFGDTYRHMERPWSGAHGDLRPNELLQWEVIKRAKSQGYRFADLEGVERELAEAVISGQDVPEDPAYSASSFKLKFAAPGQVVLDPTSFDYVYNPVLRFLYSCIPLKVMRSQAMRGFLFRFRETGS